MTRKTTGDSRKSASIHDRSYSTDLNRPPVLRPIAEKTVRLSCRAAPFSVLLSLLFSARRDDFVGWTARSTFLAPVGQSRRRSTGRCGKPLCGVGWSPADRLPIGPPGVSPAVLDRPRNAAHFNFHDFRSSVTHLDARAPIGVSRRLSIALSPFRGAGNSAQCCIVFFGLAFGLGCGAGNFACSRLFGRLFWLE
jgi:hypothetical protein